MKRKRFTTFALALLLLVLPIIALAGEAAELPIAMLMSICPPASEVDPQGMDFPPDVDPYALYPNVEVQSLADGLMMLGSGKVAGFQLFADVAEYVALQNPQYDVVPCPMPPFSLHIVATQNNEPLIADINSAMDAMKDDGTIDALWQAHVTAVLGGEAPQDIALPSFAGADTLRVGVSGDCPPIDYISPAGVPMGYNVALLAALAEKLQMNLEPVVMDSGARFIALNAGTIDLFFWHSHAMPQEEIPAEIINTMIEYSTMGGAVVVSEPYATQGMAYLVPKAE